MGEYFVLDGHRVVLCTDLIEWAKKFERKNRRVGDDTKDNVRVSTVFLGLDHSFGQGPPLLFETMVFGGEHHGDMDRYSTWEQAEKGHKAMCKKVFE